MRSKNADFILGLLFVVLALVTLFIWIPFDIETGLIEKVRRRTEIGDAFAPTLATCLLLLAGILLVIEAVRADSKPEINRTNFFYVLGLIAFFIVAFAVMRWSGPLVVSLFGSDGVAGYRPLRDTAPWKFVGFILGGTLLVSGLICFIERRVRLRSLLIGLVSSLFLILVYDLPFDDLVLPPNGDV